MDSPWQDRAVAEFHARKSFGRRILITAPTGAGKTRVMGRLTQDSRATSLYTNRRLLLGQTSLVFGGLDIDHGVRAAGWEEDLDKLVQVSSVQTEHSRVTKLKKWSLHPADLVLIDEAHLQKGESVQALVKQHLDMRAVVCGLTATPIDMADYYDELIIGCTVSEARNERRLVVAHHYGPDEPGLQRLKAARMTADGTDVPDGKAKKAMGPLPELYGRVSAWFDKLNPERRPTILFGPDVDGSLWFAQKFFAAGIPAAHVDANRVWVNGQWLANDLNLDKQKAIDMTKSGEVVVLCNRFLLREGIDAPWLSHAIMATIFGSLQSYLQSGGRILRSYPGKEHATIQDHGGNWWRHGSFNADRHWELEYTERMVYGIRADRLRSKREEEPWRCPKCGRIVQRTKCPCGYASTGKKSRPVVTMDGDLVEMHGDVFKPRRTAKGTPNELKDWQSMYYRAKAADMTFSSAYALFAKEHFFQWPQEGWPLTPIDGWEKYRLVKEVPLDRLH